MQIKKPHSITCKIHVEAMATKKDNQHGITPELKHPFQFCFLVSSQANKVSKKVATKPIREVKFSQPKDKFNRGKPAAFYETT